MKIRPWNIRAAVVLAMLAAVLSGCAYGPAGQAAAAEQSQPVQDEKKEPAKTEQSANSLSPSAVPIQLKQGSTVKLNKAIHYDLPVIDFVDSKTGFAVKEQFDASLRLMSTQDGGAHWLERKVPGEYVRSLDFINSKTGYILVEENCSASGGQLQCKQIRLLKTGDGGSTWNTKWKAASSEDRTKANQVLRRLSFANGQSGAMLVGGSLLITEDGGAHFKAAAFGIKDFKPISASFPKASTGYVIGTAGKDDGKLVVLKTGNRGRTWTRQLEIKAKDSPLSAFQIQFANENAGWLLTDDTGMLSGDIYRTLDGGKHWSKMSTQRTGRPYVDGIQLIDGNTSMISLHPGAGPVEGGIWLTKDGGKSFTSVSKAAAVNQLQMVSTKIVWAAVDGMNGSDFLIHTSDGGISWQESYPFSDPNNKPTEDFSFVNQQDGYGIGTQLDSGQVLKTTDGGASWNIIATLNSYIRLEKISFFNEKEGFIIAYREKEPQHVLLKTNDAGLTWHEVSGALNKLGLYDIYTFRFFDRNHGVLFAAGGGKSIYRTSDGGTTWNETMQSKDGGVDMKISFTSFSNGWMLKPSEKKGQIELIRLVEGKGSQTVMTLSRDWYPEGGYFTDEEHGYLFFEDFNTRDGFGSHLVATTDGGRTWTDHPFPAHAELDDANLIYFSDPQHGWIQFSQGIAETTDSGLSWTVPQ